MNQNIKHKHQATIIKTYKNLPGLLKKIAKYLRSVAVRVRHHRYWAWGVFLAGTALTVAVLLSLFLPQTIHFSYATGQNCVASPKLFPGVFHSANTGTFRITRPAAWSIGHTAIYTSRICASPRLAPKANAKQTIIERWGSIHKKIHVVTTSYPAVPDARTLGIRPVALSKSLDFRLSSVDTTFGYAISAHNIFAPCTQIGVILHCGLGALKLEYGATYPASLVRTFHGQIVDKIITKQIQTISAAAIVQTSIAAGGIVYDQPQQITLQTNKPLTALKAVTLFIKNPDGSATAVPVTSSFEGSTITVKLAAVPARKANFDLHIENVEANDSSTLETPYDLAFATSGGPKVTGVNLATSGIAFDSTFVVSFDQALLPTQNAGDAVTLIVNGTKQSANVTISGQKLQVKLAGSFPVCARVTLQISNVLQNIYNVSGDSNWSFSTRAQCYTTFSIGASVKGRAMTAYRFGTGPSMVMYIGATHGSESNTATLLQKWIAALIASPDSIPANRTLVVIPQINPDGVAAGTRKNADNVDLNRNFPSNNWQTVVTEPDGASTNAGGPSPLSEPESKALAAYVQANHPRFVLTYHSHAGIVEANEAGDSVSLAAQYATKAKYQAIPTSAIGNTFDYSTTGAFEDWMNDKLGWPAFVIELQSSTADEYSRNESAMWFMTQI